MVQWILGYLNCRRQGWKIKPRYHAFHALALLLEPHRNGLVIISKLRYLGFPIFFCYRRSCRDRPALALSIAIPRERTHIILCACMYVYHDCGAGLVNASG